MNRRRIFLVLSGLGVAATVWPWKLSAAESGPPGATVESVVAVARGLSPELAAARLDADAASYKAGAAGVLDDPTLTFQAWDVNGRGVGQRWVGVEQQFRLWGKLDLERSAATAEAEAARHLSDAAESDLIARVKAVYAQYCATRRAVELAASLRARVDESLALLRLKYGPTAVE
jgi:outer membrane protein TolC